MRRAVITLLLCVGTFSAMRAAKRFTSVGLENVPCTITRVDAGGCLFGQLGDGTCIGGGYYDHGQEGYPGDPQTSLGYYRSGLWVTSATEVKAYTDATGYYESPRLKAGTYTVRCDASKYRGQPNGVTERTVTFGAPGDPTIVSEGNDFHVTSAPVAPNIRSELLTFGAEAIGLSADSIIINGQLATQCTGRLERSAIRYLVSGGTPTPTEGQRVDVGELLTLRSGSEIARFRGVSLIDGAAPQMHMTCGTVFQTPAQLQRRAVTESTRRAR